MSENEIDKNAPWYATIVSRIAVDVPILLLAAYGFHLQASGVITQMEVIAQKLERLTLAMESIKLTPYQREFR